MGASRLFLFFVVELNRYRLFLCRGQKHVVYFSYLLRFSQAGNSHYVNDDICLERFSSAFVVKFLQLVSYTPIVDQYPNYSCKRNGSRPRYIWGTDISPLDNSPLELAKRHYQ